MPTRSLFSPFSRGVDPYAARSIGNLFRPRDDIEVSPEFLALLQSGVEPSQEMLMTTPMFKGGQSAKEANARALSSMVLGTFNENLRNKSEKELIPLRATQELEKQKEFSKFGRKQAKEVEEENLSEFGTAIGPVLGNLTEEQLSGIIPKGVALHSPADQARMYDANVGIKTPVSKALIETNPDVIRGRIGEEASKRYVRLGGDYLYDTQTGEFVQGGTYQPETTLTQVPSGKMVPNYDAQGNYIGMTQEMIPKSTTVNNYRPGFRGSVGPQPTQAGLDNIPKESGANVSTKQPASYNEAVRPSITTPNKAVGEEKDNITNPLPTIVSPKENNTTMYSGGIPTVLGAVDTVQKGAMSYPFKLNKMLAENMESLIPSKEIQPIVDAAGEGIYGMGQGLNRLRQALIKSNKEDIQKVNPGSDPLSLYLNMINSGLTAGGNATSEILQGIMSPNPDTKPYGFPKGFKKKEKKKDYRNFSVK